MPGADSDSSEGAQAMNKIDDFGRRHPRLALALTMAVAVVVTLILLGQSQAPVVLYRAF